MSQNELEKCSIIARCTGDKRNIWEFPALFSPRYKMDACLYAFESFWSWKFRHWTCTVISVTFYSQWREHVDNPASTKPLRWQMYDSCGTDQKNKKKFWGTQMSITNKWSTTLNVTASAFRHFSCTDLPRPCLQMEICRSCFITLLFHLDGFGLSSNEKFCHSCVTAAVVFFGNFLTPNWVICVFVGKLICVRISRVGAGSWLMGRRQFSWPITAVPQPAVAFMRHCS